MFYAPISLAGVRPFPPCLPVGVPVYSAAPHTPLLPAAPECVSQHSHHQARVHELGELSTVSLLNLRELHKTKNGHHAQQQEEGRREGMAARQDMKWCQPKNLLSIVC